MEHLQDILSRSRQCTPQVLHCLVDFGSLQSHLTSNFLSDSVLGISAKSPILLWICYLEDNEIR